MRTSFHPQGSVSFTACFFQGTEGGNSGERKAWLFPPAKRLLAIKTNRSVAAMQDTDLDLELKVVCFSFAAGMS